MNQVAEKVITIDYEPQSYQWEIHKHPARYKVIVIGRRGGKTEMAINEIVDASMSAPGLYWFIAPSYRQVKSIVWRRLKMLLKADRYWKFNEMELSAIHTLRKTTIELKGADNEDSLRGVGLRGGILDEAAMIKPNVWPEIIRPMLADTNGWAWFISTPKGRNWFYEVSLKEKEDKNWKTWHFPTSVNAYISKDELLQAQKDMSEKLYRQEILAEFLEDDLSVFRKVYTCITGTFKNPIPGRFYVMGVDLAKHIDFTVLTVIDSITREVVAFDRFQDINWTEQKIRIQKLAQHYNNTLVILDSSGVGDPILDDLRKTHVSVDGVKFTNVIKNQLIENLIIAIEQRLITFPHIEVLINELMSFEHVVLAGGGIKYSAPEGKHDDCVISLALAVWGIRHLLHEAQQVKIEEDVLLEDKQGAGIKVEHEEDEYTVQSGY